MTITPEIMQAISMLLLISVIVIPFLLVMIPQAIQNNKENKRLKNYPDWSEFKTCPKCGYPTFPPNRLICDHQNPFVALKFVEQTLSCLKCDSTTQVRVEIEQ